MEAKPAEHHHEHYWGLRPRRAIRRRLMLGIAVLLLGVIVFEAIWLVRHGS